MNATSRRKSRKHPRERGIYDYPQRITIPAGIYLTPETYYELGTFTVVGYQLPATMVSKRTDLKSSSTYNDDWRAWEFKYQVISRKAEETTCRLVLSTTTTEETEPTDFLTVDDEGTLEIRIYANQPMASITIAGLPRRNNQTFTNWGILSSLSGDIKPIPLPT